MQTVTIPELKVPARTVSSNTDSELPPFIARYLGVEETDIHSFRIIRRSIDARKKPQVFLLYRLHVTLRDTARPDRCEIPEQEAPAYFPPESKNSLLHPLVVGTGPAGLFAALILALAGCKPILLDRGRDVVRRKLDLDGFFRTRQVNPESNFLFGEGGAGTWSDGKLFTRIRDPRIEFVLRTFVEHGAPEQTLYFSHPHLGSDRLPDIIASIRNRITELGGTVLWDKHVAAPLIRDGICRGIQLADGETMEAPAVLIASGHSARDLILSLVKEGVSCAMKGFQTGVRIEHPQEWVDHVQFGGVLPAAGAAEYAVADPRKDGSGMVSFCMCPGGEIIPAVSVPGTLCTNGMSNAARNGVYANSALVTTFPADAFDSPQDAFDFLTEYEKNVFQAGGADYTSPAQNAADFLRGTASHRLFRTSYRFGITPARLDRLIPARLQDALLRSLPAFERKMPGFIREGLLVGIETGVSSPVRFLRDPGTLSSSVPHLWIAGEGAGYAGGITSAAVDGIQAAEKMLNIKY